jgi:beta-glucosidase/6-phospho-beta-glucosidase/beta-galactosidase
MVTLYHWDTPLWLVDTYGGWLSENIVNDFVEYARIAYGRFGDRVKYWFTVNERKAHPSRYVPGLKALTMSSDRILPTASVPSKLLPDL